jgi:C4-dicarboxylate transporter DctQ subunit
MKVTIRKISAFGKAINWCCGFAHFLGELGIFMLLIVVLYGVILRYIFNKAPLWTEEIGCYLFIFCIWIVIGGVLRDDHHIRLDLFLKWLSPPKRLLLEICISFVGLLFCSILAWFGIKYVVFQYIAKFKTTSFLTVPYWILFSFIPLGCILMGLEYLVKISGYISFLLTSGNRLDNEGKR